jgi:hypothetical protein
MMPVKSFKFILHLIIIVFFVFCEESTLNYELQDNNIIRISFGCDIFLETSMRKVMKDYDINACDVKFISLVEDDSVDKVFHNFLNEKSSDSSKLLVVQHMEQLHEEKLTKVNFIYRITDNTFEHGNIAVQILWDLKHDNRTWTSDDDEKWKIILMDRLQNAEGTVNGAALVGRISYSDFQLDCEEVSNEDRVKVLKGELIRECNEQMSTLVTETSTTIAVEETNNNAIDVTSLIFVSKVFVPAGIALMSLVVCFVLFYFVGRKREVLIEKSEVKVDSPTLNSADSISLNSIPIETSPVQRGRKSSTPIADKNGSPRLRSTHYTHTYNTRSKKLMK